MAILVTGSAGFIGMHVVQSLLDHQHAVIGIDNLNDYYEVELKLARLEKLRAASSGNNYQFIKLDLTDTDALNRLFREENIDRVIHLAAQAGVRYSLENPRAYVDSNILGFMNILEACRHHEVEHLVYASSSSVYGANGSVPFSVLDNVDHPLSMYAASKKANELMAHTYSHLYGLPTTGLRFFTVYGPWGRPDMAPFLFARAILSDEPIKVFNYGNHSRDFTYIDDIVQGVIRVVNCPATADPDWSALKPNPATSKAPWRIYNIGNSQPVPLMDFIRAFELALGKPAKKEMLPMQPGDVPDTYADVTELVEMFGYKPQVAIEEGVGRFVDWYKDYYQVS
ncbi:MAG: UDP-glucuronate 4-epimerase [Cellvibrionaceae bacterium]|jgi:UDP-glucuronate 4-epimerase